jgi:hypothetical protein
MARRFAGRRQYGRGVPVVAQVRRRVHQADPGRAGHWPGHHGHPDRTVVGGVPYPHATAPQQVVGRRIRRPRQITDLMSELSQPLPHDRPLLLLSNTERSRRTGHAGPAGGGAGEPVHPGVPVYLGELAGPLRPGLGERIGSRVSGVDPGDLPGRAGQRIGEHRGGLWREHAGQHRARRYVDKSAAHGVTLLKPAEHGTGGGSFARAQVLCRGEQQRILHRARTQMLVRRGEEFFDVRSRAPAHARCFLW